MPRSLLNSDYHAPVAPTPASPIHSGGCLEDRVAMLEDQQAELISANTELRAEMSALLEWALTLVTT